jgi:hypothetical protein
LATKYWIPGGDGNYSGDTNYSTTSGGANDTTHAIDGDALVCDANSGAGTITVNVSSAATSIVFTGFTGGFAGSAALQLKGNLTAAATMSAWTYSGTITTANTSGTATLTSAGFTLCGGLVRNGAGGTVTFADAFVTTGTCTLTAGTWNDGNQNLTMAAWIAGTGTATRVITYGNAGNVWTINGSGTVWTGGGTGWSHNGSVALSSSVAFTYTGGSSRTITRAAAGRLPNSSFHGSGAIAFTDGGTGYSAQFSGFADFSDYSGAATFAGGNADDGAFRFVGVTLSATGTFTATTGSQKGGFGVGTVTSNGATITASVEVSFATTGCVLADDLRITEAFIVGVLGGTSVFDAAGFNVTCATFNSSTTTTRTITMGSGTWTLTSTAATTVFNLATTTGLTLNPGTATIDLTGVTTNVRTITANSVLLPTIRISGGTGAGSVTLTNVNCAGLTFANTYACTGFANQSVTIRGPVTLSNHASFALTAGANAWTLASTSGSNAFTSQGKTCGFPITVNGVGGTHAFADAFTHGITRTLTLTNGTVDFASYTHTMGFFASSNANVRVIATGTATLNFPTTGTVWDTSTSTNLSVTGTGTIALTANSATARTITGGSALLPSLSMATGSFAPTFTSCNFLSFTNTSGYTGTLANQTLTVRGNITLSSAATYSSGSNTWTWACASGSALFTMNGKTLAWPLSVSAAGGQHFFADAPVFSAATTVTGAGPLGAQANFTMPTVGTWTFTGPWTYAPSGAGKLVTFNALLPTTGTITVNGTGGIILQDTPPTFTTANALTVAAGTLDTNDKAITTPSLTFSGAGVRTLTLGASVVSLTGTGTVLDASGTNQTVNAGTSIIDQTDGTSTLKTMNLGGKTWAAVRGKKSGSNRLKLVPAGGACDFAWAA